MPETIDFTVRFAFTGIVIVFIALTIISLAIAFIRKSDESWQKKENRKNEIIAGKNEQTIDTTTLILISAAAATMLKGRFHIRKVRRLMSNDKVSSPWSLQGRATLLGSHIIHKKD